MWGDRQQFPIVGLVVTEHYSQWMTLQLPRRRTTYFRRCRVQVPRTRLPVPLLWGESDRITRDRRPG